MRAIVRISLWWFSAVCCATACNTATQLERQTPSEGICSIASLKSRCTTDYAPITEEISIRGVLVGNDHYGEFPKTLVVQDATGGITITADQAQLYRSFPFGCLVTVACNGLTLAQWGGKVLLGAEADGQYGVTRIPGSELARYLRVEGQAPIEPPAPLAFGAVGPQHIDTFVRFDKVHFTKEGTWCDLDAEHHPVTTEHTITNAAQESFVVRVPATCTYAKEPVPSGTGSLFGVIDYFAGKYSLRVSDRSISFTDSEAPPTTYP